MNTTTTLIILAIILGGVGAYYFIEQNTDQMIEEGVTTTSEEDGEAMDSNTMMEAEDASMVMEAGEGEVMETMMMTAHGSYELYDASKIALAEEQDVVLFFRASWCPTCRALDADLRSNVDTIPADLVVLDVNYDSETQLKQKYGVTYQHTLVQVDADGNLVNKWSGSPTIADLVKNVE